MLVIAAIVVLGVGDAAAAMLTGRSMSKVSPRERKRDLNRDHWY